MRVEVRRRPGQAGTVFEISRLQVEVDALPVDEPQRERIRAMLEGLRARSSSPAD